MQQIAAMLQKIKELSTKDKPELIDIDLMLDHTRAIYASLLDMRSNFVAGSVHIVDSPPAIIAEETVTEKAQLTEPAAEPEMEIKEIIQQLHISTEPEPTLEDIIPEILENNGIENSIPVEDTPGEAYLKRPKQELVSEPISKAGDASVQHSAIEDVPAATPKQNNGIAYDIRRSIGINDKYQYISELFGNDKDAYEAVLTQLNNFTNYPDAVNWMDEVHTEHKWDDDDAIVALFYNTLSHFFASR